MFSFGSDPEFMLVRDGQYRSAIGVIQGSIENPIHIRGHGFYYDNVLAEAAVRPSITKEQTVANFRECFQLYAEMAAPYKLVPQSAQNYAPSELTHSDAKKVNCAPEFCPYEMEQAKSPVDEILYGTLRTCGGHVHLGSEHLIEGHYGILSMYMMDLFLGIPSLWLDKDPTSAIRRSMYGAAGRYRVKPYGMEYRSLSNFWLQSPRLVEFVYDISEFVVEYVASGEAGQHWHFDEEVFYNSDRLADAWTCLTYDPNLVREGIKSGNRDLVQGLFEMAQGLLPFRLKNEMLSLCGTNSKSFYEEWKLAA